MNNIEESVQFLELNFSVRRKGGKKGNNLSSNIM